MSENKVKFYKNPNRSQTEQRQTYTPQYKIIGVEPEEFKSAIVPDNALSVVKTPQTSDNPRTRKPGIRQPYAEATNSPIGAGRGPVPNVGNNMEHTWSSVDGELVDDMLSVDDNHPMIDNNQFVTSEALGLPEELSTLDEVKTPPAKIFNPQSTVTSTSDIDDVLPILHNLTEGAYLLLVSGVAICSGSIEDIQEQARLLVLGEHTLCGGNAIPVDDILVIKRVIVKVGLFLE